MVKTVMFRVIVCLAAVLFITGCPPLPGHIMYWRSIDAVLAERPNIKFDGSQKLKTVKKKLIAVLQNYDMVFIDEIRDSPKRFAKLQTEHQSEPNSKPITQFGKENGGMTIWKFDGGKCSTTKEGGSINWALIVAVHGDHIWVRRFVYDLSANGLYYPHFTGKAITDEGCVSQFTKEWVKIVADAVKPATILDPVCHRLAYSL